ncbi:MerR family transcriptional regulator [Arthrobacter antioxidans]|uniref:MerR family transcriptional regulator n=1 Tax=Arthrobacter antioxidans TaxID=2895818 RepID=UPI001FFF87A3|nr:MerR family transcriptional regulator [Arthrobacter antioxidans]
MGAERRMKISRLSEVTGIAAPTIKMYLREGLLAPGEKSRPNQADYGDAHVRRLKLVHGLLRVGGLSIASTREVVAAIESDVALVETFGVAQRAATAVVDPASASEHAYEVVDDLTADWANDPCGPGRALAATSITAFEAAGQRNSAQWYERYAAAALLLAEADLDLIEAREGRAEKAEAVVLGTLLGDTLLAGLRRAAQEHVSNVRYPLPDATGHRHQVPL